MSFSGSVDDACRQLYAEDPSTFLARRTELVAAIDDAGTAAAVKALRKPTLPAWIVNAHVAAEPDCVDALTGLGDRLRRAHADLDTTVMRELSLERRTLVADLTKAAVRSSGWTGSSQTVRDDVTATFDAAVADPDIAARLGLLQRPEHWSGFGVAVSGAPTLSLVPPATHGTKPKQEPKTEPAKPTPQAVRDRTRRREKVTQAEEAFHAANEQYDTSQGTEDELHRRVRRLTTKLSTVQHDLEQARRDLDAARKATRDARRTRRTAQSVLDRAERAASADQPD